MNITNLGVSRGRKGRHLASRPSLVLRGLLAMSLLLGLSLPQQAMAQSYGGKLTPTAGSLHIRFGEAQSAEGDTLAIGDTEYRDTVFPCNPGRGAVAVYKRVNGSFQFSQRLLHTPNVGETKLGASVALKGNILVASAPRERFSAALPEAGAIRIFKRSSASAQFVHTGNAFSPSAVSVTGGTFTVYSGVANNGTYIAGVDHPAAGFKAQVFRIQTDGTATHAVTVNLPALPGNVRSLFITQNNVLVVLHGGTDRPLAYQLAQSGGVTTATAIDTSALASAGNTAHGSMAGDGNTVILTKVLGGPTPSESIQIVKFGTSTVASHETRYLSHAYDGLSPGQAMWGGTPGLAVKENVGFFVGLPTASAVLGFKYAGNTYNYAGQVDLLGPYGVTGTHFAASVAFNGTEFFVGDEQIINQPGGSNPCTQPANQGAVHVYTPRSTLPTGPGSSRELTSWLYSQDGDHGAVAATNGSFVATGSAFAYQAPGTFGEITLYQNVSGTWQQIEKYVDGNSGYNGFGSSVDLSSEFLAIGAGSAANPNNGVNTGMVYLKQNTGSGFGHSPWYNNLGPPSTVGAFANFGDAVALSGNTLVVGAPGINRAYVYEWNGSFWDGPKVLQSSVSQTNEEFGKAVAVSGSYVMVGAPYRAISGRDETGAVQFFRKNSSGNYVAAGEYSVPSGVVGNAAMGRTVAITQYYAVAGAPEGHAVTFRRVSGTTTWLQDSTLLTATSEFGFGDAVAILGNDLLIGAQYSQRVHRYARSGSAFVQNGVLVGSSSGFFGSAVDLWNDGTIRAVIGDFDAPVGTVSSGAAFFLNLSQVQ
jgi:hypothetical protein